MSIRSEAFKWYEKNYGKIEAPTYTSKFYQPEESWPKKSVWWPQIPTSAIDGFGYINILCQRAPNKYDFHYLKVPRSFLHENLDKFHTIGNIISLYLSTDPKTLFIEERGKGNLDFRKFLVNAKMH